MKEFLEDMTVQDIFLMLVVMVGVAVLLCILAAATRKMSEKEDKRQPLRKEIAKVVEKPRLESGTIVALSEIWICFELESGERIRLLAKANNSLIVGDVGELTWQGKRIVGFKRQNKTGFLP